MMKIINQIVKWFTLTHLFYLFLFPAVLSGYSTSDFPQFRYDDYNSGASLSTGPTQHPKVLWVLKLKTQLTGALISSRKTLFFGDLNNRIYSVDGDTGDVLWYKKLKQRGKSPIGIHNSPLFYKKTVIIANGDGYLYAFDKDKGRLIWGPIDLKEPIYSSPVIKGKFLYITTTGKGHLWIIRASNGKLVFKKPIRVGLPVYSTLVIVNSLLHITVLSKVITFKIDFSKKKYYRLRDIPIQGSITSSPIYNKSKLYFTTRRFLYCINLLLRKIEWVKKVKTVPINEIRKTYPSPVFTQNIIFHGNRGYQATSGVTNWHFWTYGTTTSDSIASKRMLYMGGQYRLYDRSYGFVAGLNIQTEGVVFWLTLEKAPISPIILANKTLYFATEDQKLYAIR